MKSPFVRRSRLEAERTRVQNCEIRLAKVSRELGAMGAQLRETIDICETRRREVEHLKEIEQLCERRREEIEKLCELRQGEIEQLKQVEKLCEQRRQQLDEFTGVVKLCERRRQELTILHTDLAMASHSHLLLLDELKEARQALLLKTGASPKPKQRLPLMIGVDVEPDKREVDRQDPCWHGATALFQKLPELRQRLNEMAGSGGPVVFTWFVRADPQIEVANGDTAYAFRQFSEEWSAALAAGDEIGLHVHPWRWVESQGRWMQDYGDAEWINHCVQMAFDTYRSYFGKSPASYCSGDRFVSSSVIQKLEELGIKADFSLERLPGAERLLSYELGTGSIPDTSRVPSCAYRPSADDFRIPDPSRRSGLGLMPLTAYSGGHLAPWLPPAIFARGLELVLQDPTPLTHLGFIARTDIAIAPSLEHFVTNLENLARWANEGALQFATGEKAWERARQWLDAESNNQALA